MILRNLTIMGAPGENQIETWQDRIVAVQKNKDGKEGIWFENAVALPGLINSHDHLDFNLFPQLGNGNYGNYREWGADIHTTYPNIIEKIKKIPPPLRIAWGLYKNLLNGFTTVVNHGPRIKAGNGPISVYQDCYPLHSPGFERKWKWKLNNPLTAGRSVVMHIGEGTDELARKEMDEVIKWNLFRRKIIAVHGIAMSRQQAAAFGGLIWCPASNYFLAGKTAPVQELKTAVNIVIGTDSTLSASWNAWEHFRMGLECGIRPAELLEMLTTRPAALWKCRNRGYLARNKRADIIIIKKKKDLFCAGPEDILLVVHQGNIRLYDASLADQVKDNVTAGFSKVNVNGAPKFLEGNVPGLMEEIRFFCPDVVFPISVYRAQSTLPTVNCRL